jgi:hypothetical protein
MCYVFNTWCILSAFKVLPSADCRSTSKNGKGEELRTDEKKDHASPPWWSLEHPFLKKRCLKKSATFLFIFCPGGFQEHMVLAYSTQSSKGQSDQVKKKGFAHSYSRYKVKPKSSSSYSSGIPVPWNRDGKVYKKNVKLRYLLTSQKKKKKKRRFN